MVTGRHALNVQVRENVIYLHGNTSSLNILHQYPPLTAPAFCSQPYVSHAEPSGSAVAGSKLSIQWNVEKTQGNIGGPVAELCHRNERKEERRERRCRVAKVDGELINRQDDMRCNK